MDQDKKTAQELAGKVDALVGKRNHQSDERNIPVLTDLVVAPPWPAQQVTHTGSAVGAASWAAAAPLSPTSATQPIAVDATTKILRQMSDDQIDQLSHDILQRVSQRIDAELATSLEARLSEQFHGQLNATITHVLADMKQSIANEIGDAVNAALADRLRKR